MICALPSCNEPVYIEPRTRIAHKYCGRSHAIEAGETLQAPHGKCMECNLRGCRKSVAFDAETGRVHDFCSRDHAQRAISRGEWAVPLREQGHISASSSTQYCQFPRCGLPVYFDNTDRRYDYCGRSHAVEHHKLLEERRRESDELEDDPQQVGNEMQAAGFPSLSSSSSTTASVFDNRSSQSTDRGDGPMCVVCLQPKADTILIPCGHVCLCADDANRMKNSINGLNECPMCKRAVTTTNIVYLNLDR